MYIDRILYPVTALGPGKRLALWVSGCSRRCVGCANPELWIQRPEQKTDVDTLARVITSQIAMEEVEGITITGGEPFDQAEEVEELLRKLEFHGDVLIFSGYKIEDLRKMSAADSLLRQISVLIDGEYIEERNDGKAVLRGSDNQRIHVLQEAYRERYDRYLARGRQIQNFVYEEKTDHSTDQGAEYRTISVGIHKNDRKSVTPKQEGLHDREK